VGPWIVVEGECLEGASAGLPLVLIVGSLAGGTKPSGPAYRGPAEWRRSRMEARRPRLMPAWGGGHGVDRSGRPARNMLNGPGCSGGDAVQLES
jgi:hypothetical protein